MKSKPDVLLLGNGINKAFGQPSWGELLSSFQGTVLDFKQKRRWHRLRILCKQSS